jgi:chromosome partitioning protein
MAVRLQDPGKSSDQKSATTGATKLGPTGRPICEIPTPQPKTSHGPAVVISMCNQKGGVGKTTSSINLGAALAETGRRVLLVDLDPQGALSAGLGIQSYELDTTIYNLLVDTSVSVDEVIVHTHTENLDVIPANIDLSAAEIQLVSEVGREQALYRAIYPVMDRYDYILVDCQPSLGLLTVNALACSDGVIIPMECEFFSMRGLALLTDTMDKVRAREPSTRAIPVIPGSELLSEREIGHFIPVIISEYANWIVEARRVYNG